MLPLRPVLALAAFLGMVVPAIPSQAQSGEAAPRFRVGIPDPDSPFLAAPVRASLGKQLRALAQRYPSLEVVPLSDSALAGLRKSAGCQDNSVGCLLAIGLAARVDRLFFSQAQKLPGRFLVLTVMVDSKMGRSLGERRQRVAADPKALGKALLSGFGELAGTLVKTQLKLSADVAGAEVFVDGRRVGTTPLVLTRELEAGSHELRVAKKGLGEVRKGFTVEAGQEKVVMRVDLKPIEEPAGLVGEKLRDDEPEEGSPPPEEGIPVVPLPGKGPALAKLEEPPEPTPRLEEPPEPLPVPTPRVEEPAGPGHLGLVRKPEPGPVAGVVDVAPPPAGDEPGRIASPIYEEWWFWTILGAVVVAGAATGLALGLTGEEGGGIPEGLGRVNVSF